jgi:hypothetical protein
MKIRISDQSLRIRLSQQEAQSLYAGRTLSTSLSLNALDQFAFELKTWHLAIGEVNPERNKLIVSVPQEAAHQLATIPCYRFLSEQAADNNKPLQLEIEIDLAKEKNT